MITAGLGSPPSWVLPTGLMIETILANPILLALAALVGMAIVFGGLLGFAAVRFGGWATCFGIKSTVFSADSVDSVVIPVAGLMSAIADGDSINKCPPGGEAQIQALANWLDVEPEPSTQNTESKLSPRLLTSGKTSALVAQSVFRPACRCDFGRGKQMHTVIIDECTGCDLRVEPCPVDCIDRFLERRYSALVLATAR